MHSELIDFLRWAMEQGCNIDIKARGQTYDVTNKEKTRFVRVRHQSNVPLAWSSSVTDPVLRTPLSDAERYLEKGQL